LRPAVRSAGNYAVREPREALRGGSHGEVALVSARPALKNELVPSTFYLGPAGTFSHILMRKRLGEKAALEPRPSLETVFEEVARQKGGRGLAPIENSSGGTVYDSVDLLIRHAGRIFITEELALDVRIGLLGRTGAPIRTIYSHFVQLKHHADWLRSHYPEAQVREVASTAIAAEKAAADHGGAALAAPGAAAIYGLELLAMPQVEQTVNVTHFYMIGTQPATAAKGRLKTALVAALPNVCGSLHRFLGPFARQKVSLSRIISRPVPGQPQTYVFFIEIEGGPAEAPVAKALKRAEALSESLANLGTFPVKARYKS